MTNQWRHLPAPARPIAAATDAAVTAAREHDAEALTSAVDELAGQDQAQAGLILGTTVRLLLELTHPDGLDGDDIRGVLEQSVRAAAAWQPEVDPHVVLVLLAGALGVHDDEEPAVRPDALARHSALLIAHLLGPRELPELLALALGEIERAQLND
ncbi:hypothetical protein GCM10020358_24670 [Amorphoplanes nipponensis]|uniref:Uncharacterized protein n=1 Tax=Actinoplanes nipponensis TaxID=135950 RepID=A0A919JMC6_9ACTN|nr:hypothetical protein [Actinoplanes nipponensis]GIE53428.1 hypothetical protein Ani05nite_69620 [Actinoplanes nipponensis]